MSRKPFVVTLALLLAVITLLNKVGLAHLSASEYSSRRSVYLADPLLLWTNVGLDILMTLSYVILLLGVWSLIRRLRQLPQFCNHVWGITAFLIFLSASGVTFLLRIVSVWWPMYQLFIISKFIYTLVILTAASIFCYNVHKLANSIRYFVNLHQATQEQGEKLRRSEEFLDRTNRLAGIGGWELNLLTEEVTWSTETCRIHGADPGYKPTLAEGLNMYAASARPTIIAAVQAATLGGPGWDLELPVVRFDGRLIWARTVGVAEFKDGKALRLSGAFQDVTAKVEAREALRRANDRVSLAANSGGIGIWDWDIAGGVLTCDAWMYRLHGKDPARSQIADRLWRNHLHPADKVRVEQALNDAVHGVREYDAEFRVIWEDGSVHHLRGAARVTRDERGQAMNMIGANWDVTESKLLLSRLAEQHEHLRVTLQSIGEGVVTTDAQGAVAWLNPVAEQLSGWSNTDAIGLPLNQVFRTRARENESIENVNRFVTNYVAAPFHDVLIARDGRTYDIESSTAPILNKSCKALGHVFVFRDVTEKRRLILEAESATKLQIKLKDEFLSHVSHELRSPLTSIYSFSSIIADDLAGETTPQQKEYLQIILKNVVQLQSMIEDLLTVTQSREGKLSLRPEGVILVEAIVDTIHILQGAAAKKDMQITLSEGASLPLAYADPIRFRQVLIILLDNAIKFTPESGKITVHVAEKDSDFLLIQVKDTGVGVPEEKWAQIFENLYQVRDASHADTSHAGRTGLGLGLHIARNLVHRQGGNIWVNSVPNQGSVFSFTVPIYSEQDTRSNLDLVP